MTTPIKTDVFTHTSLSTMSVGDEEVGKGHYLVKV